MSDFTYPESLAFKLAESAVAFANKVEKEGFLHTSLLAKKVAEVHVFVEATLLDLFLGKFDRPSNFSEIVIYVANYVMDTADLEDYNTDDVYIGFRLFLERDIYYED